MRKFRILLYVILSVMAGVSCTNDTPEPDNILKLRPLTYEEQTLLNSSNEFSFKLLSMLDVREPDQNTLFSSFGVGNGIGMAFNIIENKPKEELKDYLNINEVRDIEIHRAYFQLGEILNLIDPEIQFTRANSLWINNDQNIDPLSGDKIMAYYDANVDFLDFKNQKSVNKINSWIDARSYGKIPDIINEVNPEDKSYVINAIHFDASWNTPLTLDRPESYDFTTSRGNLEKCDRINHYSGKLNYYSDEHISLYDIPLGNKQFYLTLIQPNNVFSLHQIIEQLNINEVEEYLDNTIEKEQNIYLPEIDFNKEIRLKSLFPELGLTGPISVIEKYYPVSHLFISDFIHKTRFNIKSRYHSDLSQGDQPSSEKTINESIIIDSPFVFLVREKFTGSIVFTGKMVNPE